MFLPEAVRSRALEMEGLNHGFFGRRGGVSEGIYKSLNAGSGSKDSGIAVGENRRLIARSLNLDEDRLLSVYQVHSARAVTVTEPFAGRHEDRPQADALVTNVAGLGLSILTADCAPVLLFDPEAHVIGAAHAGWKGALGGVLGGVVSAMEGLGAKADRIRAAIGPCIAQLSYEVGPEFLSSFIETDRENERFFLGGRGDRLHFDLKGYCAASLAATGVRQVDLLPQDTCADEEGYFSNRRAVKRQEGDYGRNLSAIVLQA